MKKNESAADQAERLVRMTWRLIHGEAFTTAKIMREFGVSKATAKRDGALLDRILRKVELKAGPQPKRVVRVAKPVRRIVRLLEAA